MSNLSAVASPTNLDAELNKQLERARRDKEDCFANAVDLGGLMGFADNAVEEAILQELLTSEASA